MVWTLLALCLVLMPPPRGPAPRCADQGPDSDREDRRPVGLHVVGAVAAAIAGMVMVPLPWALVVAGGGACLAWRFLPRDLSRPEERRALLIARDLPDVVDLLAAVLRAGVTDGQAVAMIAQASEGPLARPLARIAQHRALGASAAEAWAAVDEPALAELASALTRHSDTGSPVAAVLDRVAADARREYFAQAQAAARAGAVRSVIPLAVCFLPAFVLVGVVPVVASLVSGLSFF